jgi:hypothetical protein
MPEIFSLFSRIATDFYLALQNLRLGVRQFVLRQVSNNLPVGQNLVEKRGIGAATQKKDPLLFIALKQVDSGGNQSRKKK